MMAARMFPHSELMFLAVRVITWSSCFHFTMKTLRRELMDHWVHSGVRCVASLPNLWWYTHKTGILWCCSGFFSGSAGNCAVITTWPRPLPLPNLVQLTSCIGLPPSKEVWGFVGIRVPWYLRGVKASWGLHGQKKPENFTMFVNVCCN